MSYINGHHIDNIIDNLNNFHTEYFYESNKTRYVLIGERFYPIRDIVRQPKFFVKTILRKQKKLLFCCLPFHCKSIIIKNNLRIFGSGIYDKHSVKVAVNSAHRTGRLYREIKARKILMSKKLSFIPRIIKHDVNGKWVVEELIIDSKSFSKAHKVEEFINKYALPFYLTTARAKPLKRFFNIDTMKLIPEKTVNTVDFDLDLPVALCHGDLSHSNMLMDKNNQLYLVDWELAGVRPVALDVLNIYVKFPEFRKSILILLNNLSSKKEVDSNVQMGLALTKNIYSIKQNKGRKIKYFIDRGIEKERAIERVNKDIETKLGLLNELL